MEMLVRVLNFGPVISIKLSLPSKKKIFNGEGSQVFVKTLSDENYTCILLILID